MFLITAIDITIYVFIFHFENFFDQVKIIVYHESVVGSVAQSLNGTVYFNCYVFLTAVVLYLPNHFVDNMVKSGSAGVLLVTEKCYLSVLVGNVELLVDKSVSLFYQKDRGSYAGYDITLALSLTGRSLGVILGGVCLEVVSIRVVGIWCYGLLVGCAVLLERILSQGDKC